ncbi:hypothetical protein CHUAL_009920 [Chamberlinius hualienensis]
MSGKFGSAECRPPPLRKPRQKEKKIEYQDIVSVELGEDDILISPVEDGDVNLVNVVDEVHWVDGQTLMPKIKDTSIRTSVSSDETALSKLMGIGHRPMDDSQVFGDYVATTLRSMNLDLNKRLLKRKIERVILEVTELDDGGISAANGDGCSNNNQRLQKKPKSK